MPRNLLEKAKQFQRLQSAFDDSLQHECDKNRCRSPPA
jgi:hypothetical protein